MATGGGAAALGRSHDLGTSKNADLVLLKNDDSPVSFPLLNPHGHVVLRTQRSGVHTVSTATGSVESTSGRCATTSRTPSSTSTAGSARANGTREPGSLAGLHRAAIFIWSGG
ncbi:hypothetical protein [Streptomyces sp. MJM1172]|uniref:hypothetical protein n=1 Tax=Streptomyces sp. MJM1172 TaxID=1703926 RepID=UPI000B22EBD0|nr:hypothetical protein [Streptomyces sp. MJM1172]